VQTEKTAFNKPLCERTVKSEGVFMNNPFIYTQSLLSKIKSVLFQRKIAIIPFELKKQFNQQQLKNSLYRLKILAIAMTLFSLFNIIVNLFGNYRISQIGRLEQIRYFDFNIVYSINFINIIVYVLFILLGATFSKKGNGSILWLICFFVVIISFFINLINIWFAQSELQILYIFTAALFLNVFVPDFKPTIFIILTMLFYFAAVCIIAVHHLFSNIWSIQLFMANVFIAILIIKIVLYNNNANVFINTSKINTLNKNLEALSITDELTKLNNRRSLLDYMGIIWRQSCRLRLPLSVLMIDVDYFKKYNDSMGHLEGDKVLIAIAQCMKSQLKRETDFVARFGGEEFVCLFPYIEQAEAVNFSKKIVQGVEDMKIPHPMSEHSKYVTISAGMSYIVPDDNYSPTQLLNEADKALYMAKQSGRNKLIIFTG
jgi:diguanylate cyclase (GGDEF)-like protein